ncbi:hypothetical protein O6H91_09G121800 [Diphasiastrum complanatum]|uniref:Uncharacterized protein n=1 Tax=Diphasiastrum complanatum TaxID=34168 RepID=A0ACC2CTW2_DIPCM|nr:hypothetical protein O6H91_09G121800 [Diphasiastrum complanatum]
MMKLLTVVVFACVFLDCLLLVIVCLGTIFHQIPGVNSRMIGIAADKASIRSDDDRFVSAAVHQETSIVASGDSAEKKNVVSGSELEIFASTENAYVLEDSCDSEDRTEDAKSSLLIRSNRLESPPDSLLDLEMIATEDGTKITSDLLDTSDSENASSPVLTSKSSVYGAWEILNGFEELKRTSVPAFFIFGDSTVDSGNNNYLITLARANLPPYGRDFDTHRPTGRFSNGRLTVDYIASFLGLPLVPAYLTQQNASTMQHGVNFASGGAGILLSSGADLGQHIPFVEQIKDMLDTIDEFVLLLGEETAKTLVSRSIAYISIGSNDYIHYYLRNVSGVQHKFAPDDFSQILVSRLSEQITALYNGGVRKMVVVGVGPLGCAPHYLFQEAASAAGRCVDDLNIMVNDYNSAVNVAVEDLNRRLPGMNIIFCDIYAVLQRIIESPRTYGFETVSDACCGSQVYGGWMMCIFPEMACKNASTYLWWDEFHPTEMTNYVLANSMWWDTDHAICSPMSVQQLATL